MKEEVKHRIKRDLVAFRDVVLSNDAAQELEPAPFHFALSDILLNGKKHAAVEMFRESGKTSYALRAFPIHCLAFPSKARDYIVIIKQNQQVATNKLNDIVREYEANPLARHNLVAIREQNSRAFSVDVRNEKGEIVNVRIEAFGKGAAIRGLNNMDRRPKVIILDDIQDADDARSEAVTAADWDWFLSDVVFLGKATRIFFIGNNLGERCCIERCIRSAEELHFDVLRIPVMTDGVPAWPAKDTIDGIMAERADYERLGKLDIWMAEKMCQAVAEESRVFAEEDFRYFSPHRVDELAESCNVYACMDPASSTRPDACYRAITVTAVDAANNWFLLNVRFGRWDTFGIIEEVFATVRRFRLRDFYIEKGWWEQVARPIFEQEMKRRNVFFNIVPLEHARVGSKLERIKALQPRFRAHSVYFPDMVDWLAEFKAELSGVTKDAIKSEYIDCVDAFAMTEQVAIAPLGNRNAEVFGRRSRSEQPTESLFEIAGF